MEFRDPDTLVSTSEDGTSIVWDTCAGAPNAPCGLSQGQGEKVALTTKTEQLVGHFLVTAKDDLVLVHHAPQHHAHGEDNTPRGLSQGQGTAAVIWTKTQGIDGAGTNASQQGNYMAITHMQHYQNYSFEELRVEDYEANRKNAGEKKPEANRKNAGEKKPVAFFRATSRVTSIACDGDKIGVGCANGTVLHLRAAWLIEQLP